MDKIQIRTIEVPQFAQANEAAIPGDAQIFVPENVCAKMIRFAVDQGKIAHLDFTGGCDGNLKAISRLLVGMNVDEVVHKLEGLTCGKKTTSCVDQLCSGLRAYQK